MESSSALTCFPQRPARASGAQGKPCSVFSNYFTLEFDSPDIKGISKYVVKFTPEVPDNSSKFRRTILKTVRDKIKEKIEFYIEWGNCLYSYRQCSDIPELQTEVEGTQYTIKIEWVQIMEPTDKDHLNFLKIFFNSMMRSLRFEQIGRKQFNQAKKQVLEAHKIQVWPGFDARLILKEFGVLLNIDVCFKVIRSDSVLQLLDEIKDKADQKGLDFKEEVTAALTGATVVTRYNNRTYRIERVDFDKSPETTFDKNGTPCSYKEYYKTRYNENINDPNQPLLINKDRKTGNEIALIPELCCQTGLTDSMRADFRLMKDLAQITHTNADRKVQECKNLFDVFKSNQKCQEKMKLWKLSFKDNPVKLGGYKYAAGNLVMGSKPSGERNQFDIEQCARDIDRKIQDKMYDQPDLETWGIFYGERDANTAKQFLSTLEKCEQFGYQYKAPAMFPVKNGMRFDCWQRELESKVKPGVQAVVLLTPGQKGKNPLYDELKRLLLTDCPVPSQVVLCNTIARGKNVRSIVNKILIQICAKIGGIPWTVDNLPLMDKPTMICGMDVFHSTALGAKSVLGFCASINNSSTKYWSTTEIQDVGQEMAHTLCKSMEKAVNKFKVANGVHPERVILYRDGVGEGQVQTVCSIEIEQIRQAFKNVGIDCQLMYLNVNKRVNTRIFGEGDSRMAFKNPMPGTVLDNGIVDRDLYEFYLISVAAKQGMASPTKYTIVYDSTGESPDKIELLTYKLCYTYYNVSGSIKVPATIQYAHRLAALIGERGGKNKDPPRVHDHFEENLTSLYFI